jgi:hypothetical protein
VTEATPPDQQAAASRGVGPAQAGNLALRFLLELAALAALGFWGFHTGGSLLADVLLGVGAPMLAAGVWGTFAAPKSSKRLRGTALPIVQLVVLGAGAVALVAAGQPVLGAVFAALIVVNVALMHVWGQDGRPPATSANG